MKPPRPALVVALLALVLAGLAWTWRVELLHGWWEVQSQRPLDVEQQAAVEACGDPGWMGLLRVLRQDLEPGCAPGWFVEAAAPYVEGERGAWLRRVALHPAEPARVRLRAGAALLAAGEPPVPGLALLAADPTAGDGARRAVIDLLAREDVEVAWADPSLRGEAAVWQLAAGELEAAPAVVARLRTDALETDPSTRETRAWLSGIALQAVGLDEERLAALAVRRRDRLPLHDVPMWMVEVVSARLDACSDPADPACMRLAADLLERYHQAMREGLEGEAYGSEAPPHPEVDLPRPLWAVLHEGEAASVAASTELLGAVAAWIARADERERPGRLLGAVAHRHHRFDIASARAGHLGDPVHAVRHRRSAPWTSALAAVALGDAADVEVGVEAVGDGVVVHAGRLAAGIGPCGELRAVPPPEESGPRWPREAVLAQAVLEAVGHALREGRAIEARRLAVVAERIDPVGAEAVVERVESILPLAGGEGARHVGTMAGDLVVPLPMRAPQGAESARRERAAALGEEAEAWAEGESSDDCPTTLGP